jgi:hypothetical protein
MDAIIGRYRVHTEDTFIVLQHPTGISLDLKPEEALAFTNFITVYRQILTTVERTTAPTLPAIPRRRKDQQT